MAAVKKLMLRAPFSLLTHHSGHLSTKRNEN